MISNAAVSDNDLGMLQDKPARELQLETMTSPEQSAHLSAVAAAEQLLLLIVQQL